MSLKKVLLSAFFIFSFVVWENTYAVATIVGSAITINDGTEASPYSIIDVVSDINDTAHIEQLSNGIILVKSRVNMYTGHLLIPEGVVIEKRNFFDINGGGLHLGAGSMVYNRHAGSFGGPPQIRSGLLRTYSKGDIRPHYIQAAGARDDFLAAREGLAGYNNITYKIDGLDIYLLNEAHYKWYTSNASSYIRNLSIFQGDSYVGSTPTGFQLSYGSTLENATSNLFAIAGDFTNLGAKSKLIDPTFHISGNVDMRGYFWSATLIDIIDMVTEGGTWTGNINPNTIQNGNQTRFLNTAKFNYRFNGTDLEGVKVVAIPTKTGGHANSQAVSTQTLISNTSGVTAFQDLLRREFLGTGSTPVTTTSWEFRAFSYERDVNFTPFASGEITNKIEESFLAGVSDQVVETNKTTVETYTNANTPERILDLGRLWFYNNLETTALQEPPLKKNGSVLELLSGWNLVLDATAASVFSVNEAGQTITVKSTALVCNSIFDKISTSTGTITLSNGATNDCIRTDINGTTGRLTLTGVDTANVLVYDDASAGDDTISYQTTQSGTITIPFNATSSTDYQVVVRRQGYSEANFSFDPSTGGFFSFPINQTRALTVEGTAIYQNGGSVAKITMDYAGKKINIGDFTIGAQELYDTLQDLEVTELAMKNPRIGNYDGNDKVLLLSGYQFRNRDGGAAVPGVNAFVFAETGGVLDDTNGSIQFLTNDTATVDRQEQIIKMIQALQGSAWNNNTDVYARADAHIINIVGTGFDPTTDSLSNVVQSMLTTGILDVNTIKDLLE